MKREVASPFPIGLEWFNSMLVANGNEFLALLSAHRHKIHIAFGHVHVNTSGTRGEISFSGSRGTCHKIMADPTADFADYVDHGPAYDIILVEPDSVCVHNIDPAGPNRLIAREHATPDERGSWTTFRDAAIDRWM